LFLAMLAAFMIPFQAIITPLYVVLHTIGLSNSLVGLTFVYITFQLPFGLFLMRNSFGALPSDLEESAQLDGCSLFSTLWRVMLPLAVPGVVTTALFSFFTSWNEFFAALILITDQSKFTLPVTLSVLQTGQFGTIDWGVLEAGVVLSAAPCVVLFLLLQKYYVGGLLSGAVK
jgi:multiple sugar transport system permease protein